MDNREERFDRNIISEMGALGLLGPTIPEEYGGAGRTMRSSSVSSLSRSSVDRPY
jgi:glutaryl-CoA dehydrogenase